MGPGPSNYNSGGPNIGGGVPANSNVFTPFPYNIPPNPNAPPANPSSSSSTEKKDLNYNSSFIQEDGGAVGGDNVANDAANIPPPSYDSLSPDDNLAESSNNKPKPQPRSKILPGAGNNSSFPELPNVPLDLPDVPDDTNNEEIDFDDLSRRFEELKKRK